MAVAPAHSSRFIPNSGEVCRKSPSVPVQAESPRAAGPPGVQRVVNGSNHASTTTSCESNGVSTSQKPRASKKRRTSASNSARSRNTSSEAAGRKSAGLLFPAAAVTLSEQDMEQHLSVTLQRSNGSEHDCSEPPLRPLPAARIGCVPVLLGPHAAFRFARLSTSGSLIVFCASWRAWCSASSITRLE